MICAQPRDLRRIDPHLSLTSSSPVIVVRNEVLLVHVSTIRIAVFATHAILFQNSRGGASAHMHFLRSLCSRLASCAGATIMRQAATNLHHHSTGILDIPVFITILGFRV